MKNFKVFDCFTFYNELEILHVRFEELYDFVDYLICILDNLSGSNYIEEYRKLISTLKMTKKY